MPDVLVDRLRIHTPHGAGPAPDPQASARALDLALPFPDRQVLIVRRLAVTSGDRNAAQARLETMQRQAAHPADGPADPRAEAVVFADEAEALLCLTRDVVSGRAGQWYWAGRLPIHASGTGEVLGWLWGAQPRWVPAVLSRLARSEPDLAARALCALPPGASEMIARAVAREYDVPEPRSGPFTAPPRGPAPADGDDIARLQALTLPDNPVDYGGLRNGSASTGARLSAAMPGHSWEKPPDVVLPAAARRLLELAVSLVPPVPPLSSLLVVASRAATHPASAEASQSRRAQPTESPSGRPWSHQPASTSSSTEITATTPKGATGTHGAGGTGGVASAAIDEDTPRSVPRRAGTDVDLTTNLRGDGIPAWSGSVSTTRSAVASAAYAIALMQRTGAFPAAAARGQSGWAAVESAARWLLAGLPERRRRAALRDPLFRVLGELDGRQPTDAPPGAPDLATRRRMLALLSRHGVPRAAFARAGTVHVSRTHVDVVLPINAIDLLVRSAGLDQDPGWVPGLARVVLVHFEGGG